MHIGITWATFRKYKSLGPHFWRSNWPGWSPGTDTSANSPTDSHIGPSVRLASIAVYRMPTSNWEKSLEYCNNNLVHLWLLWCLNGFCISSYPNYLTDPDNKYPDKIPILTPPPCSPSCVRSPRNIVSRCLSSTDTWISVSSTNLQLSQYLWSKRRCSRHADTKPKKGSQQFPERHARCP